MDCILVSNFKKLGFDLFILYRRTKKRNIIILYVLFWDEDWIFKKSRHLESHKKYLLHVPLLVFALEQKRKEIKKLSKLYRERFLVN